ncbi:hypothetical protein Scep_015028 [Stephania cephalantha]|uniref:Uncharacterized protein n=1 Tax=Stephania cephalantha TaxID=152367 RepID=A0AAP0J4I4_9MAGN
MVDTPPLSFGKGFIWCSILLWKIRCSGERAGFWCSDEAALISTETLEEEKKKRWKLCKVADVDETTMALRLIPMSMTFIVVGKICAVLLAYLVGHISKRGGRPGLLLFIVLAAQYKYMASTKEEGELPEEENDNADDCFQEKFSCCCAC